MPHWKLHSTLYIPLCFCVLSPRPAPESHDFTYRLDYLCLGKVKKSVRWGTRQLAFSFQLSFPFFQLREFVCEGEGCVWTHTSHMHTRTSEDSFAVHSLFPSLHDCQWFSSGSPGFSRQAHLSTEPSLWSMLTIMKSRTVLWCPCVHMGGVGPYTSLPLTHKHTQLKKEKESWKESASWWVPHLTDFLTFPRQRVSGLALVNQVGFELTKIRRPLPPECWH